MFSRLNPELQRKIVTEMFERTVQAGEILINEGDTGLAATELYVVKSGKFEVGEIPIPGSGSTNIVSQLRGSLFTGLAKATGPECPRQYEGKGRLLRRDLPDVRLSQKCHRCSDRRRSGLGHGPRCLQVGMSHANSDGRHAHGFDGGHAHGIAWV